ncbi:probable palmitoyltransferase ZDHHC24 [Ambystoma mexicanum]|uniref:probable palmitoyltransferase ZDHHC24 n=1 Tax=Ambystoma mexicanum TaxID=8296 RepID=UPI0037E7236F
MAMKVSFLTCCWRRFDATLHLPVCITLGMITCVVLEVLFIILHEQGPAQDQSKAAHLLLFTFLLLNVLSNAAMFMKTNPSIRGVFLTDNSVGLGWEYCYACQTHVPPRSQHCYNCKVCILRRDHHCVLLGQCLGHANYRYLIGLLIYGWIGLLYATVLNAENFLALLHEGISAHSLFLLLMPWMMLVTGQVSTSAFVSAFVADTCVVGFLFCSGVLALHTALLYRGATCKEWFAGHRRYDLGWRRNVRESLGTRWFLIWLSPWISSPLPGDGINFETRSPSIQQPLKTDL